MSFSQLLFTSAAVTLVVVITLTLIPTFLLCLCVGYVFCLLVTADTPVDGQRITNPGEESVGQIRQVPVRRSLSSSSSSWNGELLKSSVTTGKMKIAIVW